MWVRIMEWMLVDDEPPRPAPGSLLRSVGLRVHGVATVADATTPDGLAEVQNSDGAGQPRSVYALTGTADAAQDIWTNIGERQERDQHAGSEFVLTIGADRFQVQIEGPASNVPPDSRVTVTGELRLVGEYEWDAFELTDTRADWVVRSVVALARGDIAVDLSHPSA
ncbi:hypothetical protein [Nocardioides sp. Iso805N]|uniref:hypothetical protein n=1 Tax=Nocardioides sp. Iso805N TaxID=1283287 RepID=UPI00035C6141|nr:hypothetical protein [Nocardioides sp. Iso805N]